MPPTRTRSGAQPTAGITKKVHRKPRAPVKEPSDSWELLDREGLDPYVDEGDDGMFDRNEEYSFAGESPVDVEEVVRPVREMADKVGREVELFAETLDKFLEQLPEVDSRDDWAHDLVSEFKAIADSRVEELKKSNEREMREQLKQEWSEHVPAASTGLKPFTTSGSSVVTSRKAREVKELRQWQQESDIWELLLIMLDIHNSQATQQDKDAQIAQLSPVHRYTSQDELWERFLLEDNLALERQKIKTWLEQTADHQASSLPDIVSELEAKAGRGKGLWSSGWMHTREKIKAEKRLRSWPNAADSPLPQIKRSDNSELLVTTLDPDAPIRQSRTLEKPDQYFERAVWIACWEMLRRGADFNDVCAWCEERREGWRALSMGRALEALDAVQSSAAWRHMCNVVSQSGSATEYEAAVFGVLGGNVKAAEKVCRTIDDQLWAYYSTTLLRQFDVYVSKVCPSKALPAAWRHTSTDPEHGQRTIEDLIMRLRRGSSSSEAAEPMKIIQSFLLANDISGLIHAIGAAISQTDVVQGSQELVFFRGSRVQSSEDLPAETQVALNPQTLRIAAHMYIVHQSLTSPVHETGVALPEDENVLVAYIQALRTAVKRSLIPTYASKLSRERSTVILARVCADITEPQEQVFFVRLMQEVDLDIVSIFREQLSWAMNSMLSDGFVEQPFRLLEPAGKEEQLFPGVKINPDLLPNEITGSDEGVVRALGWFKHMRGGWDVTFKAMGRALRKCLVTGRFATARLILESYPFERICLEKSYETLGRSIGNIFDDSTITPHDENEFLNLNLMRKQARTYFELENLVGAVEMLCIWRTEEEKLYSEGPVNVSTGHRADMKDLKQKMDVAMEPLMQGILLHPIDEDEAKDLEQIRITYLPEIIIGYVVVLHTAGLALSREGLLDAMDVSTAIANGKVDNEGEAQENNGLAECFVRAGRMRELMEVFAHVSKSMLVVKSKGRPWKMNKRDRMGRNLGMWELGAGAVVERD